MEAFSISIRQKPKRPSKEGTLKDKGKVVVRAKRMCLRCDKSFGSRYGARLCKNCKDVIRDIEDLGVNPFYDESRDSSGGTHII